MSNQDKNSEMMPANYRMMIYFAVATMSIYSKGVETTQSMNPDQFREKYPDLVQRVFDEGLNIFNYELSHLQITKAIIVFLQTRHTPSSVFERPAYMPKEKCS